MNGAREVETDAAPASIDSPPLIPGRPPGVPAAAKWNDLEGEWHLTKTDELGHRHGPFRSWRADGSPRLICSFSHGTEAGVVWILHPDGSLYFSGCYDNGIARGMHQKYASAHPEAERLQSCCVPAEAWELRQDFKGPRTVDRGWFRRDGMRLLDSGAIYPDRPATVWREARYNESLSAWETVLAYEDKAAHGTRRQWSADGVLRLVESVADNKRHGQARSYDAHGALEWDANYVAGRLSGPFRAIQSPGFFSDDAVREQVGAFEVDQATGVWRYLDGKGAFVVQRDMGVVVDEQAWLESPALANQRRPASWWNRLAQTLTTERRVSESLLAAARAAARAKDPAILKRALATCAAPLSASAAQDEARRALERGAENPVVFIDALKRGCEPSTILWALAKALPDHDRAAVDLVSAALLLDPSAIGARATRALLYATFGDLVSARSDAAHIAATANLGEETSEQGEFLQLCLRVYFPRFSFWPDEFQFDIEGADVFPIGNVRSVDEVRDVIQRYATRLGRLRAALISRLREEHDDVIQGQSDGDPSQVPFMISDLSALLPDGPVSLARYTYQMSLEEYEGEVGADDPAAATAEATWARDDTSDTLDTSQPPSSVEIIVDETQKVDPTPSTILEILRTARADWSALMWLCWAAGLPAPTLPNQVQPPPAFACAAVMATERTWRCRDKIRTCGLLAMTRNIPGFDWEGISIDQLPGALAEIPLNEYLEIRSVFAWLCDDANRSPWQDDLRSADG